MWWHGLTHIHAWIVNRRTTVAPTCIMDLSEYISSMVLWILEMLPCRSESKLYKYEAMNITVN